MAQFLFFTSIVHLITVVLQKNKLSGENKQMKRARWQNKLCEKTSCFSQIKENYRVVLGMAATEPKYFLNEVHHHINDFKNVKIYCANPMATYPCMENEYDPELLSFEIMFLSSKLGFGDLKPHLQYVPQHLSHWAKNIMSLGPVDLFWGTCSEPDDRGFVSLGLGNCYESEIINHAKNVILEINPHMPKTLGGALIPTEWVDHFFYNENPLSTIERAPITAIDERIGEYIADLIPDGATLQFGIGGTPNALSKSLLGKKDLGIHTEMINDSMMELFNRGVITGKSKTLWPGKMVGSFIMGSQELYDFANENYAIELHPSSVVNDPYRMGRNYKMHSVNSAIEVDITGQVCSESIGHRELSGIGGATDTHTGAQRSQGGRGIVAIHSTVANGKTSKIVSELKAGAKVSISRNDIDTVVTEYGVAQLKGRSVTERAKALIQIAAPQFREQLYHDAVKNGYI